MPIPVTARWQALSMHDNNFSVSSFGDTEQHALLVFQTPALVFKELVGTNHAHPILLERKNITRK